MARRRDVRPALQRAGPGEPAGARCIMGADREDRGGHFWRGARRETRRFG